MPSSLQMATQKSGIQNKRQSTIDVFVCYGALVSERLHLRVERAPQRHNKSGKLSLSPKFVSCRHISKRIWQYTIDAAVHLLKLK